MSVCVCLAQPRVGAIVAGSVVAGLVFAAFIAVVIVGVACLVVKGKFGGATFK